MRYFLCLNGKELFQWFDGKLQLKLCSCESSKLLVTFLLSLPLSTDAFLGAKHFNRDDKRGERHAYFVKDPAKRLNSSILDCFMVSEPMGCFFSMY